MMNRCEKKDPGSVCRFLMLFYLYKMKRETFKFGH